MTTDSTGFGLPIRVDIATGERLEPTGLDPYALPWVQGAAATVPRAILRRYYSQVTNLAEKLALFKKQGMVYYTDPIYGPRPRTAAFYIAQGRPLPSDGNPFGWEHE